MWEKVKIDSFLTEFVRKSKNKWFLTEFVGKSKNRFFYWICGKKQKYFLAEFVGKSKNGVLRLYIFWSILKCPKLTDRGVSYRQILLLSIIPQNKKLTGTFLKKGVKHYS